MRWDNLTLSSDVDALFGADRVVERTFDTPEFWGMTFYEVRARSIINKVPGGSRMPFGWTINPYRGCSHACRYCLVGETPILMADGGTKPLAEVRVGDAIYGTVRKGAYRRFAVTEVLAHWRTVKPAYRVTLEDGTELVASADHRFLTGRGWKHVTGATSGARRRPHLTTHDELLGTGAFADQPQPGPAYRRGYLCGMVRGDGHVGTYSYSRPGRTRGDVHRFRLALTDLEALDRAQEYLESIPISTQRFAFTPATAVRRPLTGIRTSARDGVNAVREVMRWPDTLRDDWCRGFLAGIFDAEGSCSAGVLRIDNTDPDIIDWIAACLRRFGFEFRVEDPGRANAIRVVRLLGGMCERLRFFHTTDPAISRKRSVEGVAIKNRARLRVVSVGELGLELPMYDITTGTGDFIADGVVSHNCFARRTHEYLDLDAGIDFDTKVVVKLNAPELVRVELARPRWAGEHIAMGTNVDCYQRAEGRYRLMPGILAALRDARNPFSILTKGTLVLRDLDLLRESVEVTDVAVNLSIGSVDATAWRDVEPGTPSPRARLGACRTLTDAGIGCGVLMAPILPHLTDAPEQLDATVRAIAEAGARSVSPLVLHLRPGAREWYLGWLEREHPELLPRYRELYGRGAYAPKSYQADVAARVARLARGYGIGRASPTQARGAVLAEDRPVRRATEQPTLL